MPAVLAIQYGYYEYLDCNTAGPCSLSDSCHNVLPAKHFYYFLFLKTNYIYNLNMADLAALKKGN